MTMLDINSSNTLTWKTGCVTDCKWVSGRRGVGGGAVLDADGSSTLTGQEFEDGLRH